MKNSVMLLLGSGSSLPGDFPTTDLITSQVRTGRGAFLATDGRYYLSAETEADGKHSTDPRLSAVLYLFEQISDLMQEYEKQESLTYEILYYFVEQLHAFESGDLLNMALLPFIRDVRQRMQTARIPELSLLDILGEAERYIRHMVWRMLDLPANRHGHLSLLSDAFGDDDFTQVNVATLNHDLLVEQHLVAHKIDYRDGFGAPVKGVRYWEHLFGYTANLLKIHGSINWFALQPVSGDWFDEAIGIVLDADIDHVTSPRGKRSRSVRDKEPHVLVGTFNKVYEYTESIFSEVYCSFRNLLASSAYLVVSGYSFGDKGVNNAILEWIYKDRQHRVVVIHETPERLLGAEARSAIRKAYNGVAAPSFRLIPKWIQDTSWQDVRSILSCDEG